MKKFAILMLIISCFWSYSCSSYDYDLEKMGEAVQSHLKYRDADNGTITKIEYLKAVSYKEISQNEREKPDEAYLCKVYIKGTWAYMDSYRIYNIDDTLNCFFTKNKTFLRIEGFKER